MVKMTNLELTNKLAKQLGLRKLHIEVLHGGIADDNHRFIEQMLGSNLPDDWEAWKVFGLMVENAKEMGWNICLTEKFSSFRKLKEDSLYIEKETNSYNIIDSGTIKATALAFLEIF